MEIPTSKLVSKFVCLLIISAATLCLVQCGTTPAPKSPSVSSEHCGGIACTGVSTCTNASNVPLCADPLSATCHSASHECVYKLKVSDSNCPCMEHDVQLCMVDASTPGVSICTANGGRTATSWAACIACPGCT